LRGLVARWSTTALPKKPAAERALLKPRLQDALAQ
jgi:hypothetical protein